MVKHLCLEEVGHFVVTSRKLVPRGVTYAVAGVLRRIDSIGCIASKTFDRVCA